MSVEFEHVINCFHPLNISAIEIEEKQLNNPFFYEPDELSSFAADKLKEYLLLHPWKHNFGFKKGDTSIYQGKMFGVLVVKNINNEIGFLAGFSGKIDDSSHHKGFVPPIFDLLTEDGFFKKGTQEIDLLTERIEKFKNDTTYNKLNSKREELIKTYNSNLAELKLKHKENKVLRKIRRSTETSDKEVAALNWESHQEHFQLKDLKDKYKSDLNILDGEISLLKEELDILKQERKEKSNQVQSEIFESYQFLNSKGESKHLLELFIDPPRSGAGDCAAPKLYQFAFQNNLTPIASAEFWWGKSPVQEIRHHEVFYPACNSRCKPILKHMLDGLDVMQNPLEINTHQSEPEVLFEDDVIIVINKPPDFLSVPGKTERMDVETFIRNKYENLDGPVIVHRLDMPTSGIMILAKTNETYLELQSQFIKRKVSKRYVALLEGELTENEGEIELPIRIDLEDRPRQLVCYEYGKHSKTIWKKIEVKDGRTRVHFFPITGRTHQLRVHAAHLTGLNTPIVGDVLYGKRDNRLHLHAESLTLTHPITKKKIVFKAPAEF